MRGLELRDEEKVWNGVAASECRIGLMEMMIKQKIAFADLEEFGQEFKNKVKSTKLRNKLSTRSNLGKVTQPAMRIKLADEQNLRRELVGVKYKMRREMEKTLGGYKSRGYKAAMSHLTQAAKNTKQKLKIKYKMKMEHLKEKYDKRENSEGEIQNPPEGLEEQAKLGVPHSKSKLSVPNQIHIATWNLLDF